MNREIRAVVVENTWLLSFANHGWGNGYVLLPEGHKYFGEHYDNIPVDIHGGLTFSELVDESIAQHLNDPESLGMWCIGFDTCHCGDSFEKWPMLEVKKEANRLLGQVK